MEWNEETAKAFAEEVGQQIGQQMAEQMNLTISSAVSEGITQGMSKLFGMNASALGSTVNTSTSRETDVSEGERATIGNLNDGDLYNLNKKMTYDSFLEMNLSGARRAQLQFDQMSLTNLSHYNRVLAMTEQNLSSSLATADMTAKNAVHNNNLANGQTLDDRDLATNEKWNISEANIIAMKAILGSGVDAAVIVEILKNMVTPEETTEETI